MVLKLDTNSKTGLFLFLIFPIIFIILGVSTVFVAQDVKKKEVVCTQETTGILQNISKNVRYEKEHGKNKHVTYYEGEYQYVVNGRPYIDDISTRTRIKDGDAIKILYNQNNPSEHIAPQFDLSSTMTVVIGIAFTMIGCIAFVIWVFTVARRLNNGI